MILKSENNDLRKKLSEKPERSQIEIEQALEIKRLRTLLKD